MVKKMLDFGYTGGTNGITVHQMPKYGLLMGF